MLFFLGSLLLIIHNTLNGCQYSSKTFQLQRGTTMKHKAFEKRLLYCSEDKLCFFKYGNISRSRAKQQDSKNMVELSESFIIQLHY